MLSIRPKTIITSSCAFLSSAMRQLCHTALSRRNRAIRQLRQSMVSQGIYCPSGGKGCPTQPIRHLPIWKWSRLLRRKDRSTGKRKIDYTVRTFAPEQWGQLDRFATFFAASFPNAKYVERRAVSGAGNHFRKAMVLRSLAIRMMATLVIDRQQLAEKGYTPAEHAVDLAAVVENVFTELYSAVDCARQVFSARYPGQGLPNSTRKMFARVCSGVLDTVLPSELLSAFKEADWYDPLRVLRDEITHWDVGSVHQDETTGKVSYICMWALAPEKVIQLCGLHQGGALIREIRPEQPITFDSGKCLAVARIEAEGKPTCDTKAYAIEE
jgi:hypothetical protein